MSQSPACELCTEDGGQVLYRQDGLRVVLVSDADYPGFCRVIWDAHVKEMSELAVAERERLMAVVWQVEAALREVLQPEKINLASLGNMTPHLHWHVIPRFADDPHFPAPVWAARQRENHPDSLKQRQALLPAFQKALDQRLSAVAKERTP